MAPPNRPTSHSSNSSRRTAAQPSTACTPPTMSPALCRAPRMPLVPLPQVNGHMSYPTASALPSAIRDGQWQRDNALQLTGMPPPTAPSTVTPSYTPAAVPPPYSTHAAATSVHTGAVLASPYSTSPTHTPVPLPPSSPRTEKDPKRRKSSSSSSSPPTPSPSPPLPAIAHTNARRRQSQPRSDAAQYGSSPTT